MQSVIHVLYIRRMIPLVFLAMLLSGAVWFGGLDNKISQAQSATSTLSPAQDAAIVATMVTYNATATATGVPLYDDFGAETLNSEKWVNTSDFECQVQPTDGALSMSNMRVSQPLNCSLEVDAPLLSLNQLGLIEAQIMIADNHNHLELNQGIEISSTSLTAPIYLFCGLNAEDSGVAAVTSGNILINGDMREFYTASSSVAVEYNEYHTFVWQIDGANLTAACSVDGEIIDIVPLNRTEGIDNAEFLLTLSSYRSAGAVATTHLDNIKIAPA